MAVINVDDAYVLNETGAQVDKVTGLFTKNENASASEKQMARLNIAAGGSNDNLLDNAYFVGGGSQLGDGVFPINQRGQSSYSGAVIGMDRWRNNGNGTTVLNADNVTFSNTNGWKDGLNQRYAGNRFPLGSQVTFTVQMSDLSYHSCTITVPTTADTQTLDVQAGTSGIYFAVRTNNGYHSQSFIMCDPSTSASIRRAKVELGTVSTLANDPVPDFGEELRKCQRRLFIHDFANGDIIASGFAVSASYSVCSLVLPVSMASDGTLTGTVTANPLIYGGGTSEQVSSFSVSAVKGNYAKIGVATTVMPSNNAVVLYANTNIRLTISKEL